MVLMMLFVSHELCVTRWMCGVCLLMVRLIAVEPVGVSRDELCGLVGVTHLGPAELLHQCGHRIELDVVSGDRQPELGGVSSAYIVRPSDRVHTDWSWRSEWADSGQSGRGRL
jgi:hypothetical protein